MSLVHNRLFALFATLLVMGAVSCGDTMGGEPVTTDSVSEVAPEVAFGPNGSACDQDSQCASGLCLVSEYAPFGVCIEPCDEEGTPCPDLVTFCVDYGEDFIGPLHSFCVPLCENVDDCRGIAPAYEECVPPSFKGNELYPSLPVQVCQNPSSAGKEPIDPTTCEFTYDEQSFPEAPSLCSGYCAYLAACQHVPETLTNACCEWACYDTLTDGETALDEPYKKTIRCYVDHFEAFGGVVCEASKIEAPCGGAPPIPSP